VPFSGSAADPHYDADPNKWGPLAPYLATQIDSLPKALKALKWENFDIFVQGGSWVVVRTPFKKPRINLEILMYQIELSNV